MNIRLLLHSTTGNTRLVTDYAAARFRAAGHRCEVRDVVADEGPGNLDDVDLLGVACPTHCFRPTVVMERAVARLASRGAAPRPAFLLATAGGILGAHFSVLAAALRQRGWWTLGAHWVQFVNNWPPHRRLAEGIGVHGPWVRRLDARYPAPALRWWLHLAWPDVGEPSRVGRDQLDGFLDEMVGLALRGGVAQAPPVAALDPGLAGPILVGRWVRVEHMRYVTQPRIDPRRCSRCGTCVEACPTGCVTRSRDNAVPHIGEDCTGCWACFNHCPDGALSGWAAPHGAGRYPGPSPHARHLYRV